MSDAAIASEPIEQVLETLATRRDTPEAALVACVERIGEALPALLDLLNRAAIHGLRRERDRVLLFRAVHILGTARAAAACQPLLRFLRRPGEEVEGTLGDTVTETLPRIVAGVFDGDAPALFAAIADRRIDEAARWSLLTAAAFLTWDKRIDAAATHDFLRRFGAEKLAPPARRRLDRLGRGGRRARAGRPGARGGGGLGGLSPSSSPTCASSAKPWPTRRRPPRTPGGSRPGPATSTTSWPLSIGHAPPRTPARTGPRRSRRRSPTRSAAWAATTPARAAAGASSRSAAGPQPEPKV